MRVVVGTAVLALLLAGCGTDPVLHSDYDHGGINESLGRSVGDRETWGEIMLHNEGDSPVRLVSVRFSHLPVGVRALGARMVTQQRSYGGLDADAFPPKEFRRFQRPVAGYVVPPTPKNGHGHHEDWDHEVFLGYQILRAGTWVVRGVDVVYEQGGQRRTLHIDRGFYLCVGPAGHPGDPDCVGG